MADKKSIIEAALLDISNIKSALNANTREVLRSVAKEEINSVVKESLNEVYEEEDLEDELDLDAGAEEEGSMEDDLVDVDSSVEGPEELDAEIGMDTDVLGGADMDMTAASDEEVIAIYKKLSGEDEIEIVGDDIHLNITEPGEYVVKANGLGASAPAPEMEPEMEPEMDLDMDLDSPEGGEELDLEPVDGEDDVEYEIEMDDEEDDSEFPSDLVPADGEDEEVEELDEKISSGTGMSVGTHRNPTGPGSIGAQENPKAMNESARLLVSETTKKYNTLLTEAIKLKDENAQFRTALKNFRTQLVETVLFNSNLASVTRLFVEHSTTKTEKENIVKRFDDEVTTLKESKKLYKTIVNELESRKPMNESVGNRITKAGNTSGSAKQLTENTAYVDPQIARIKEIMFAKKQ